MELVRPNGLPTGAANAGAVADPGDQRTIPLASIDDVEQLCAVRGVGRALAQRIVDQLGREEGSSSESPAT